MKSLDEKMTEKYPDGFTQEDIKYAELDNDKVVEINYTSGTTGFSKGVMLTGNNLAGNVTMPGRWIYCSGVNVSYVSCLWPMPIVALSIYWYPWHSVCMSIY